MAKLISDEKFIVNKKVFMDRALAAGNVGDWKLIRRSLLDFTSGHLKSLPDIHLSSLSVGHPNRESQQSQAQGMENLSVLTCWSWV